MEDEFFEDYSFEDFETTKSFNDILFELERNGKILEQWEMGAPVVDNRETAQKTKTKTKEL
ncbi:MAG: hypothetical protein EOL98_12390 [Negativicutes bacterium]|nr:hypothetical protein [Negativicutes bacterium]